MISGLKKFFNLILHVLLGKTAQAASLRLSVNHTLPYAKKHNPGTIELDVFDLRQ